MLQQADKAVVRNLEREDLPDVAQLFQRTFRRTASVPSSLVTYLDDILFNHPWYDDELPSKVFVSSCGRLQGFIGVFPARFELEGRVLRAAFAGSMMVADPDENPLAGARLLRAFLAGPQDISLTETANATALGMWQKLSLPFDVGYSLNWVRIFRPAGAAANIVGRMPLATSILRPVASMADIVAERVGFSTLRVLPTPGTRRVQFRDATLSKFRDAALVLKDVFPLRPRWDAQSLDWLIDHASRKRRYGRPTWRIAETRSGNIAAAYVYFGRPGGMGWLLQALCDPASAGDLVDDLFAHADGQGCSGIRGGAHPWLTSELISRKTMFHGRSCYLVHARDKSLLQPIQSGQALINGLAGENWMRLIGDRFD